jgi:hypothetical protein
LTSTPTIIDVEEEEFIQYQIEQEEIDRNDLQMFEQMKKQELVDEVEEKERE